MKDFEQMMDCQTIKSEYDGILNSACNNYLLFWWILTFLIAGKKFEPADNRKLEGITGSNILLRLPYTDMHLFGSSSNGYVKNNFG